MLSGKEINTWSCALNDSPRERVGDFCSSLFRSVSNTVGDMEGNIILREATIGMVSYLCASHSFSWHCSRIILRASVRITEPSECLLRHHVCQMEQNRSRQVYGHLIGLGHFLGLVKAIGRIQVRGS